MNRIIAFHSWKSFLDRCREYYYFFRQPQNWKPSHYRILVFFILSLWVLALAIYFVFGNNVRGNGAILKIRKGVSYQAVIDSIKSKQLLYNETSFELLANIMGYPKAVKPGRYRIKAGMSNFSIIYNFLRGKQEPLRISFVSTRTIQELAQKLAKPFEIHPDTLLAEMLSPTLLDSLGFTLQTAIAMYIPNTYEFFWTTPPKQIVGRFAQEYKKFWNEQRLAKAKAINLTPIQVSILASIVQAESYRKEEYPRIAGVYINRLNKNDKLRADPTVIYAIGDYSIRRVLLKHTLFDSPYNTYLYSGLPPGPINCPSIEAIDGVLNYEKHDYYFFCAREDFSGYHDFSVTFEEHKQKAKEYRRALDSLSVK
ncbi:MAG: endolytic transglycosylase MltG [Bacteroidia bacterium]|nr:endolytic transglycosylase MltG [Bacteroidia bacterium]MDW8158746.1 endolytic transglycosylase MltG [Bacteroidia bacterium]